MYLEFQNEIDETMFLAQQKAEMCLGDSYVPRKVLVSHITNIPRATMMHECS